MNEQSINFYPKVVGDPIKFQRVWMAVHQAPDSTTILMTTVWQDGAWWCVMVQTGSTIHRSAWGTAHTVIYTLADYGKITGINHIDFTHLN